MPYLLYTINSLSFSFIHLASHHLYGRNDRLVWLKFSKTAIVLINQSLSMLLLSILLHPIRVIHYHTGLDLSCWYCASSCFIEQYADIQPAFLHRKGKLWMTCKSGGLVQHASIMGWEQGAPEREGGGDLNCRYGGRQRDGEGVSLPGCFQSKWNTNKLPVIPSSLCPGARGSRERWEDRPLTPHVNMQGACLTHTCTSMLNMYCRPSQT